MSYLSLSNRSFPFKSFKFEKKKKNQKKRRSGSFHIRFDYFIFIIPWFALNQSYLTTIFTCVHQKTCSCMFSSRYKTLCVIGQPLCVTFLTNHHEKQVKDSFILYQSCSHDQLQNNAWYEHWMSLSDNRVRLKPLYECCT